MQLGWPLPKRKNLIERLSRTTGQPVHTVFFQGRRQDLPVHRVPIDFPKYRLDNGRTRSAQAAYIAQHPELQNDFFERDTESEPAQSAQHEILKARLGGGEKDLLRFFSAQEQMQPFILTDLGYVLNGNRRLCAFRELINQNKTQYEPQFGNIDVVFLPPADQRELDKLEAIYQLTEDIKAPYSWTARAYMLRVRKTEHDFDHEALSAIYQIPVTEVRDLLEMLSLAEEYLDEREKSEQYDIVDGDEFAFRQLLKTKSKIKDEQSKDAVQRLAFCVIEKWDEGRLYAVIPRLSENLDEIRKAIEREFPSPVETKTSKAAALLGLGSVVVDPIATALDATENRDVIREILSDVLDAAAERKREKRRGNRALARLTKAYELLNGALVDWDKSTDKKLVGAKLHELEAILAALRKQLDENLKD